MPPTLSEVPKGTPKSEDPKSEELQSRGAVPVAGHGDARALVLQQVTEKRRHDAGAGYPVHVELEEHAALRPPFRAVLSCLGRTDPPSQIRHKATQS